MDSQDFINAQKIWKIPSATMVHIEQVTDKYRMKHGMFASVPIICKATDCPYYETCTVDAQYRILNSRCAAEIAAIISRYETWCEHFGISLDATLSKEDVTDASLIRDLVDNEIQMMRAENKIALDGDFIGKTLADIDNKGKAYWEDTVGPAAKFKMELQTQRYKILQLLNSTRKDKADQLSKTESLSGKARNILEKVKNAMPNIDLDNIPDPTDNQVVESTEQKGE